MAGIPEELRVARNWYRWLWFSPIVTFPTLLWLYNQDVETTVQRIIRWNGYTLSIITLVLLSSLWHLVLVVPALTKGSSFIRWHGRQALLLAGIRTAIPIGFVILSGDEDGVLYGIPFLVIVWFFGTRWGQKQAARGECQLMQWTGRESELPSPDEALEPDQVSVKDPDDLIDILRFSQDAEERRRSLTELAALGMVERFDGKHVEIPSSTGSVISEDATPRERAGSGYTWLVALLVLIVLFCVNQVSQGVQNRSAVATGQARQTATSVAGLAITATAEAMNSWRELASEWPVVITSNFTVAESAWEFGVDNDELLVGKRSIENGRYVWIAEAKDGFIWWSIPTTERTCFDFYATVEGERVIGAEDSEIGLIFRYVDRDNFYLFVVENKQVRLQAQYEGEWKTLPWFNVPYAVNLDGANRLTVAAEGRTIRLFINDHYLGEYEDTWFGYGDVGLAISLDAGDEAKISFDNFLLRAPIPLAGESNTRLAIRKVRTGENRAREGEIVEAISDFAEAQSLDPQVNISANSWNLLCWYGSLWGYAEEVFFACENAVSEAADDANIRDSRGLARALLGDFEGAIADFEYFVERESERYPGSPDANQRKAWIQKLKSRINPFDEATLESLRSE